MKLTLATNEEINMLHSKFKKFNTHLLEEPRKTYPFIGIMDVFNRVLTEEEASELLGRSHNLKYGAKFVGFLFFLIGLLSFIFLLAYAYKEFKEDETKKSKKAFFLILGILDIILGTGGFVLILSLGSILIGLVLLFY